MFEVNDIVLLDGCTLCEYSLERNSNKFKVVAVTPGTFFEPDGFTFHVKGVVDGTRQMFSTITLESGAVKATKVDSEKQGELMKPSIKVGTKLKCSATGGNPNFKPDEIYTVESILLENENGYIFTVEGETFVGCYLLLLPARPCSHAGIWEILD